MKAPEPRQTSLAQRLVLLAVGWSFGALLITAVLLAFLFQRAAIHRVDGTLDDLNANLLAYSTVAHSGVIACGIGLLSGPGLAAAGLYAAGHACPKGALFLVTGVLTLAAPAIVPPVSSTCSPKTSTPAFCKAAAACC